jgi:hypothetical protein
MHQKKKHVCQRDTQKTAHIQLSGIEMLIWGININARPTKGKNANFHQIERE